MLLSQGDMLGCLCPGESPGLHAPDSGLTAQGGHVRIRDLPVKTIGILPDQTAPVIGRPMPEFIAMPEQRHRRSVRLDIGKFPRTGRNGHQLKGGHKSDEREKHLFHSALLLDDETLPGTVAEPYFRAVFPDDFQRIILIKKGLDPFLVTDGDLGGRPLGEVGS